MAHSPALVTLITTSTTYSTQSNPHNPHISSLQLTRRNFGFGFTGAVLGLSVAVDQSEAAARRPTPPPQGEKKDPNVSGVQAKIIASKRRKEAMEEAIAKLREKGKPIK